MAERRMFAKTIIDSDAFLDMPISARLLYYDLGMRADDDGFINAPRKIMKMIGATNDDMNILIARKFVIPFESGVVVIKAWRINNYLRSDRYNETKYLEEKAQLELDQNGMYHTKKGDDVELGIPVGIPLVSTGKDSIGKDSIDKDILSGKPDPEPREFTTSPVKEIVQYLNLKTGSHFKTSTPKTKTLINARLKEGFTVDDFKVVIDKKFVEWGSDSKMAQYLRPETLFGTKFEGYLNQKAVKQKAKNTFNEMIHTAYDFDELERMALND